MTEARTLQIDLGQYDHKRTAGLLTQRLQPPLLRYGPWVILTAYFALLALFYLFAGRVLPVDADPALAQQMAIWAPVVLSIAAYFAVLRMLSARNARVWAAVQAAPIRTGKVEVTFDDAGVTLSNPLGHTFYRWPAITDVIEAPDGLLLVAGGMDFVPIPANAFDSPAERNQLRRDILAHLATTRDTAA